jgi:lipopolysaccharide/colanic/teichoic acid biosynthesis glycosyltransferase
MGAVLGHTGIADLPQLVNILRGDITLVGKAPKIRSFVKWAAWLIVALLSGALFKEAHSVLELLAL